MRAGLSFARFGCASLVTPFPGAYAPAAICRSISGDRCTVVAGGISRGET
jgi:hypothetical protein